MNSASENIASLSHRLQLRLIVAPKDSLSTFLIHPEGCKGRENFIHFQFSYQKAFLFERELADEMLGNGGWSFRLLRRREAKPAWGVKVLYYSAARKCAVHCFLGSLLSGPRANAPLLNVPVIPMGWTDGRNGCISIRAAVSVCGWVHMCGEKCEKGNQWSEWKRNEKEC